MTDAQVRFRPCLEKVAAGETLSAREAETAFDAIMQGEVSEIELAAFLMALRVRGETVDELCGAVTAMRRLMLPVEAPDGAFDIVGTGGDARGTYNISTATALVLAGCGLPVAKHGNRAVSSKSGAADVLECLGVNIRITPTQAESCLKQSGVVFLFAPTHHPAMRHAAPVRQALKLRTIFNLLGPLANPAMVRRQLLGVFAPGWLRPMAEALQRLGSSRAWVVHGADGLDELSTTGANQVAALGGGAIESFEVAPSDAGLPQAALSDLMGGTPQENAAAIRALLDGAPGPFRDIVVLNAAAALVVSERVTDLKAGAQLAQEKIGAGAARRCLDMLIEASHAPQNIATTAA